MLLLITSNNQPHADWVEAECQARRLPYLRVHPTSFPESLELSIGGECLSALGRHGATRTCSETVQAVWHYLPGNPAPVANGAPASVLWSYWENFYATLIDCRWMNHPHAQQHANHKIYQLRVAAHLGLRTPRSLVTNSPEAASAFLRVCGGQGVFKRLSPLYWERSEEDAAYVAYVTRVGLADIEENLETIRLSPCLFQELIAKRYEITVFVIGEQVWATAIYSQEGPYGEFVDYRQNGLRSCRHEPVLLPLTVEAQCRQMTRRLGLTMCNFDLVYSSEGEYVFLDANPTEQWILVEELVGFPLCQTIVDVLAGEDTVLAHPYLRSRSLNFEPPTAIREVVSQ